MRPQFDEQLGLPHKELMMIAKYLERIGGHAANVAKWVLLSVTGNREEERHLSKETQIAREKFINQKELLKKF